MSTHVAEAKLTVEDKSLTLPAVHATDGADALGISALLKDTGTVTFDPGFVNTASCESAITYIDGDAGILRYRGYPIEQLAEQSVVPRGRLPAHLRRAAHRDAARRVRRPDPPAHAAARGPQARSSTASRATRTRCRCCRRRCQRAVDLLPGQPRPVRPASRSSSPRSGCSRSCRRSRRTRTRSRSASRSSTRTTRSGYVENFLRMTFGVPAEPLRGRPDASSRRSTCCSSCTPTTSRTARRRRCAWSARRRPTCSPSISAGINALFGPAARRRQPGRARDARADPATTAATSTGFVERVKNKERRRPAHGLRPPGLQELRPARGASSRRPPTRCSTTLGADDQLLDIAHAARGDRARRRLLRRAQALPERRLLHRPHLQGDGLPDARCSPCCSRSAGCPAGSPSGGR